VLADRIARAGKRSPASALDRTAADFLPARKTLRSLQKAAAGCQGCPLYLHATQTVFGEGPEKPRLMLVGEQPGDHEDLQGHPFVGPAGKLLQDCLEEAGLADVPTYLTNAVKHFKFEERGKKRLHKKPSNLEVVHCHPWLEAEIEVLQPEVLVCLGATAAQALLGKSFKVTQHRGEFVEAPYARYVAATVHPSSILRAGERRHEARAAFVADLVRLREVL
jgi:DNA polymerase